MSVTLLTLLQEITKAINDGETYTLAATTSTTISSAAFVNATSGASTSRFNGRWLYSTAQQRRARTNGLAPSTGVLTTYPNWVTPPSATVLVTGLFPCIPDPTGAPGEDMDWRRIINDAAGLIAKPARVSVAIPASDYFVSTATWSWLDRPSRLFQVLEPGVRGGRPKDARWRGWRLIQNATTTGIEFDTGFENASGSLTLETIRPVRNWVATAGVWANSTTGLVNDSDQLDVALEDILPVACYVAYRALAARSAVRPYPKADDMQTFWLGQAKATHWWDVTQDAEPKPEATAPAGATAA